MKFLVCTDGSEQSQKALEKAVLLAGGCNAEEVAVINVYEERPYIEAYSRQGIERQVEIKEEEKKQREKILKDASAFLEGKGIKARTIFKEGQPAETIVEVGCGEGFDFIVIGSRGLGGLKKALLGSVSNAVVQQADKCSVVVVR
ncbi:MAG: universal stress protein [Bacillota bacterium]|nr:universal stress protein [Bacillota bacterium]